MLKITTIPILVMFLTSALILPVGMSYAVSYGGTMNGTMPMTTGMTNSTMPMTHTA